MISFIYTLFLVFCTLSYSFSSEFCDAFDKEGICSPDSKSLKPRYIFYDVNPPEGFNLRRDVYLRMATFARKLKMQNWYLVLPPWPHLYHWQSEHLPIQNRLPWSLFFNVSTLSSFAPVIEMRDFFLQGKKEIDQVYVLQHFKDTFTERNFEDRMQVEPCLGQIFYKRSAKGYTGEFWGYNNITAKKVDCLSFHGPVSQLLDIIEKTEADTIMFDHAEIVLHDRFGDKIYWDARRSMKFADHLIEEAAKFRNAELNSTNERDKTAWPNFKRNAVGGNYLCVHLRRQDFVRGRSKEVPSIKGAADQIQKALKNLNITVVFIATDASTVGVVLTDDMLINAIKGVKNVFFCLVEKTELKSYLKGYKIVMYEPSGKMKKKYKDGEIAIIEQIICSHARKFIGTHESTFSFRIQEEREIMGFDPETTFNRLCGDKEVKCRPPSKWLIVF